MIIICSQGILPDMMYHKAVNAFPDCAGLLIHHLDRQPACFHLLTFTLHAPRSASSAVLDLANVSEEDASHAEVDLAIGKISISLCMGDRLSAARVDAVCCAIDILPCTVSALWLPLFGLMHVCGILHRVYKHPCEFMCCIFV